MQKVQSPTLIEGLE